VASRRAPGILLALLIALPLWTFGCSSSARYKILSFFFDGVPPPGSEKVSDASGRDGTGHRTPKGGIRSVEQALALGRRNIFTHQPYDQYRCTVCHDMERNNQLALTPEDGLCARCHPGVATRPRFVHGPVAAGACLECHHPHESEIKGILLHEATTLCLRCHDAEDLSVGDHHRLEEMIAAATRKPEPPEKPGTAPGEGDPASRKSETSVARGSCIDCHDAHGGDNRLFVKRTKEEQPNQSGPEK
jgi:predicted CXXCH cytochrome family protein